MTSISSLLFAPQMASLPALHTEQHQGSAPEDQEVILHDASIYDDIHNQYIVQYGSRGVPHQVSVVSSDIVGRILFYLRQLMFFPLDGLLASRKEKLEEDIARLKTESKEVMGPGERWLFQREIERKETKLDNLVKFWKVLGKMQEIVAKKRIAFSQELTRNELGPVASELLRVYQEGTAYRELPSKSYILREMKLGGIGGRTYFQLFTDIVDGDQSLTDVNYEDLRFKRGDVYQGLFNVIKLLLEIYLHSSNPEARLLAKSIAEEGEKQGVFPLVFDERVERLVDIFQYEYHSQIEHERLRLSYLDSRGYWPPLELEENIGASFRRVALHNPDYGKDARWLYEKRGTFKNGNKKDDKILKVGGRYLYAGRYWVEPKQVGVVTLRVLDWIAFNKRLSTRYETQGRYPEMSVRLMSFRWSNFNLPLQFYRGTFDPLRDWQLGVSVLDDYIREGGNIFRFGELRLTPVGQPMPGTWVEGVKGKGVRAIRAALIVMKFMTDDDAKVEALLVGDFLMKEYPFPDILEDGTWQYRPSPTYIAVRAFQKYIIDVLQEERLSEHSLSRLPFADQLDQIFAGVLYQSWFAKRGLVKEIDRVRQEYHQEVIGPGTVAMIDFCLNELRKRAEVTKVGGALGEFYLERNR